MRKKRFHTLQVCSTAIIVVFCVYRLRNLLNKLANHTKLVYNYNAKTYY